ncbi:MAG: laminin G, partial [Candidatus Delongbacteria bacterium]|nr:laminin G [Candidatus Delongbacteria bacterium]
MRVSHGMMVLILIVAAGVIGDPIRIGRIDQLPDRPDPYIMRDWAEVARYYDSLVFDLHRQGEYLPLVELKAFGRNYPADPAFGLHTVVGTPYPQSGEAVNALPAVIGASLAGIDKRNQFGTDWVRMCRDYYNLRPEENIY